MRKLLFLAIAVSFNSTFAKAEIPLAPAVGWETDDKWTLVYDTTVNPPMLWGDHPNDPERGPEFGFLLNSIDINGVAGTFVPEQTLLAEEKNPFTLFFNDVWNDEKLFRFSADPFGDLFLGAAIAANEDGSYPTGNELHAKLVFIGGGGAGPIPFDFHTIVPEPNSFILVLCASPALLALRRRRT